MTDGGRQTAVSQNNNKVRNRLLRQQKTASNTGLCVAEPCTQ